MGQAKYAGTAERRGSVDVFTGKINFDEAALKIPIKRKKPTKYFVNSMSDLFHESVPFEFIDKCFAAMAIASQHQFQVLTKRAERMAEYIQRTGKSIDFLETPARELGYTLRFQGIGLVGWPLPNVWLGVSCEDKLRLPRLDILRTIPAAVRFVSFEPLLEDLGEIDLSGIHWAITGGESGNDARYCSVESIRSIGRQCQSQGVAWWNKQLGTNPTTDGMTTPGSHWPQGTKKHDINFKTGRGFYVELRDKKGADQSEWPEDLRVQQMPVHANGATP